MKEEGNEFKFLSYHTEYSSRGDLNKKMAIEACFSQVFRKDGIKNAEYDVKIYKEDAVLKDHKSNACYLTKKEVDNHIKIVKYLFDFEYEIKDEDDHFLVHIKLEDKKNIYHRYILNWVRYTYEFPYNMCLRDAMWMKKQNPKKYRFESIFNLFLLTSHCYNGNYEEIHSVGKRKLFITQKELKKSIEKCSRLNDIVKCSNLRIKNIEPCYSLKSWNEDFEKRYKIYDNEYNRKKEEK